MAPGILEEVVKHAGACYPEEGCGLIAGSKGSGSKFVPVDNVLASSTEYEMDPAQLITALREMRDAGELLVAIYHSHPRGPALPSKSDIKRAYYPAAAHLIVSLAERELPQARAFRIVDGEALEVELHVIV